MSKDELIIQLVKVALGILIGGYFLWWSLEVLKRLPPLTRQARSDSIASTSVAAIVRGRPDLALRFHSRTT